MDISIRTACWVCVCVGVVRAAYLLLGKIQVSGATFWYFMASFISASNK